MSHNDNAMMASFRDVLPGRGVSFALMLVSALGFPQLGVASEDQDPAEARAIASRIAPVGKVNIEKAPVAKAAEAPAAPEPAAPAASPEPSATAVVTAAPETAPAAVGGIDLAAGESTYKTVCTVCHGMGIAGAPKMGDKDAWAPRIAQGMDTLNEHATKGFKGMPPKGGAMTMSDAQIGNAVAYMVEQSK